MEELLQHNMVCMLVRRRLGHGYDGTRRVSRTRRTDRKRRRERLGQERLLQHRTGVGIHRA